MMPAGVQAMIGHVGAASLVVIAMHGKLRSGGFRGVEMRAMREAGTVSRARAGQARGTSEVLS